MNQTGKIPTLFVKGPLSTMNATFTLSYPLYQYVCSIIEHRYDSGKPDKALAQAVGQQFDRSLLLHTLPPETIVKDILAGEKTRKMEEKK